ncbi:MAG: hypothetical protein DRO15_02525 [Thermoprotei archaeon]|nr:MAG: hypothetical protein DRO15_02525 [Thermoprotei archaeon]
MKPEEFYESMRRYCIRDWIIWTALEEARLYGFNIIYLTIATEPHICDAYLAIAYDASREDIQPLAVLTIVGRTEDLNIDVVARMAKTVSGAVIALGPYTGILMPLDTDDKIQDIDKMIMNICKELGERVCHIRIDGYYFDVFI